MSNTDKNIDLEALKIKIEREYDFILRETEKMYDMAKEGTPICPEKKKIQTDALKQLKVLKDTYNSYMKFKGKALTKGEKEAMIADGKTDVAKILKMNGTMGKIVVKTQDA